MFHVQHKPMTLDSFITFALLPENIACNFEFINGNVLEKRCISGRNWDIITNLVAETRLHCERNGLPCSISTSDGPYRVGQNIISPDFAYKRTLLTGEFPDPPLWVTEVILSNDNIVEVSTKRRKYIQSGILYWEIFPSERLIDVYELGKPLATHGIDALVPVEVIAGLTVPVAKLFR